MFAGQTKANAVSQSEMSEVPNTEPSCTLVACCLIIAHSLPEAPSMVPFPPTQQSVTSCDIENHMVSGQHDQRFFAYENMPGQITRRYDDLQQIAIAQDMSVNTSTDGDGGKRPVICEVDKVRGLSL